MNRPAPSPASRPWRRVAGAVAVVAVLGGVFALYRQPGFLVMLADQIWSCF